MPVRNKMSATRCHALKKPGMHSDGGGLYLRVSKTGSKSWIHRVTIRKKRVDLGLGPYPTVSLQAAREKADANRKAIEAGADPRAVPKSRDIPPFETLATEYHSFVQEQWKNENHRVVWLQSLKLHAFPKIGPMPVDRIDSADILDVLEPIWTTKPETGRRVKQRIRSVMAWAKSKRYVQSNPVDDIDPVALPDMLGEQEHFRALPHPKVRQFLQDLRGSNASLAVRLCLEFLILTAVRSVEARGASWEEIVVDDAIHKLHWRIPAVRMKGRKKNKREHWVPLSKRARKVLEEARPLSGGIGLIFPSPRIPGERLSDMALMKAVRDLGYADQATVHGFRSSFTDWCRDTDKPGDVADLALAHTPSKTQAAYFRSDLRQRRRKLMRQWARYVS